jgi:pimeloyl-ACP methyl ester carboxylesterase
VIAHQIPSIFSHLPPDEMEAARAQFLVGQKDLTNLSTNSQFQIAEGSGHNIQIENPAVIVAAVREMMEED